MWIERIIEVFVLGVRNLFRNKLRSFLTMLGIIFGVGSVITMLAVGAGARHEILAQIQQLGITNIIINSVEPPEKVVPKSEKSWMSSYGLTFKDAEYMRNTIPSLDRLFKVNMVKEKTWYGSTRLDASIIGVQPEYLEIFNLNVNRGRLFNHIDSAMESRVCIIRRGLLQQFPCLEDVIGMTLRVGGSPFEVIGVLEDGNFKSHTQKALSINESAQEIYIPYSSSMRVFGTVTNVQKSGSTERSKVELDQIIIRVKNTEQIFPTARMIASILKRFHDEKDYEIVVPLELLRQSEETQKVFNIVMVLIAGISLLVGGIGIANIMLATITERTKEIGIRRALGARQADILIQFLTETVAIACFGGLLGALFGVGGVYGIVKFTQWSAKIEPYFIIVSLVISCSVGILFGIFPARRAARMDPISALRRE